MQTTVKTKSSIKPKWGNNQKQSVFTEAEVAEISQYMNELRLSALKLNFLQCALINTDPSLARWLHAKGFNTWVKTGNQRNGKTLLTTAQLKNLEVGEQVVLNLFNSDEKLNGKLFIEALGDRRYLISDVIAEHRYNNLYQRGFYPDKMCNTIYNVCIKGKKDITSSRNPDFVHAFEYVRNVARQKQKEFNTQFEEWKQTISEPTIELLREINQADFELKKLNAA